jgi:hypothetical protein
MAKWKSRIDNRP